MSNGTLHQRGHVLILGLVFTAIFITLLTGLLSYIFSYARLARQTVAQGQALALAEAGIDKAIYELNISSVYAGENNTSLGNGTFSISVTPIDNYIKLVTATGSVPNATSPIARKVVKAKVGIDTSLISFKFGAQAGVGGVRLLQTSSVNGNLYTIGPATGANQNIVRGEVISAGPNGLINGIHATGTAYAHTITNSDIEGDAFYQTISATTVDGALHPNSPDQPTTTLPISDEQIEEWKAAAEAGGVISGPCPYEIDEDMTLGPIKIDCDVEVNDGTLSLTGPVWVNGDFVARLSPVIKADASLGSTGVTVIADNESDKLNSGTIAFRNSTSVEGSGTPGSHVLFISGNTSAENGGSVIAIDIGNSVPGDLLAYANHGEIAVQNNISIKEITGYKLSARNSAIITYSSGFGSSLFSSGPGGSWAVITGTYSIAP